MRIFSILAALVVTVGLALSILARPQLMALLGMSAPVDAAQPETPAEPTVTAEAETDTPEDATLVKVAVARFVAQQVDSAVILRGQTAALRQVDQCVRLGWVEMQSSQDRFVSDLLRAAVSDARRLRAQLAGVLGLSDACDGPSVSETQSA